MGEILLRTDKPQSQPKLMKKAHNGGVATALAEMFDKFSDQVWIDPGRRRELEPFGIINGEEPEIPSVRRAKTYYCCGSKMCCAPTFIEHVTLKCMSPQRTVLNGPRPIGKMPFRDP